MFMLSKDNNASKHVVKHEAAKYSDGLNTAAMHLLDLEALYHNNFINGFNTLDQSIVKNCKRDISIALHNLNLYNLYVNHADFLLVGNDNNSVLMLKELPRVMLHFNPRSAQFTGESAQDIEKDNNRVSDAVKYINNIIGQSECHNIIDVRSRYTNSEDGFLIEIKFSKHLNELEFINKMESFIEETQSLSLDELMISQQFSEWYSLEHKNPFWLHQQNETKNQTIMLSIFNIHCFSPAYFLSVLLDNIKIKVLSNIKKKLDVSENGIQNQKMQIKEKYTSINDSFVNLNFEIECGAKKYE